MNSSRFMKLVLIGMVLLVAGCGASGERPGHAPFLFSYEFNSIEPEHEELINDWLAEAAKVGYPNKQLTVNDVPIESELIGSTAYAHVRAVAEAAGCTVKWDSKNRIVNITAK